MSDTQWLDPGSYPHLYYYVTHANSHLCGVRQDCDWGGPCDWCAVCSCGWRGSVFTDSAGPGERGAGSPQHALAQLLLHVGFDPDEHAEHTRESGLRAMVRLRELAGGPVTDEVLQAIEEVTAQLRRERADSELLMAAWALRNESGNI